MATDPEGPPIVVVGASAGGIEALTTLVRGLPEDFPAAVAVVLNLPPSGTSVLPAILGRASRLPATAAADGEPVTSTSPRPTAIWWSTPASWRCRADRERTAIGHRSTRCSARPR